MANTTIFTITVNPSVWNDSAVNSINLYKRIILEALCWEWEVFTQITTLQSDESIISIGSDFALRNTLMKVCEWNINCCCNIRILSLYIPVIISLGSSTLSL